MKQVVVKLESIGWSLDGLAGSGHYRMRHPNGSFLTIPASPSDHRWAANTIADAERACGRKVERPSAAKYRTTRTAVSSFHMTLEERAASKRLDRIERQLQTKLATFAELLQSLTPRDAAGARKLMRVANSCVDLHDDLREALRPVPPLPELVIKSAEAYAPR